MLRFVLRFAAVCLFLLASSLMPAQAQGAHADYLGPWKQVASNAGRCHRCEISFDQLGGTLTVKANNGWRASVRLVGHGSNAMLKGEGAWASTVSGDLRGKRFDAGFALIRNELHMVMRIPREAGRPRLVRAVYIRHLDRRVIPITAIPEDRRSASAPDRALPPARW